MPAIDRIDVNSPPNPTVLLGPANIALICRPIVFLYKNNRIQPRGDREDYDTVAERKWGENGTLE